MRTTRVITMTRGTHRSWRALCGTVKTASRVAGSAHTAVSLAQKRDNRRSALGRPVSDSTTRERERRKVGRVKYPRRRKKSENGEDRIDIRRQLRYVDCVIVRITTRRVQQDSFSETNKPERSSTSSWPVHSRAYDRTAFIIVIEHICPINRTINFVDYLNKLK